MIVGIPKGLLYYKYNVFLKSFFEELGCEIITSEDTNKDILNKGVKLSVDDACLPVKIFHGHVMDIKDKCDILLIPRIMQLEKNKYICPKFCGLPEMIKYSIPDMPKCITYPIYATSIKELKKWAIKSGLKVTKNLYKINKALNIAIKKQQNTFTGIKKLNKNINIALLGHPYNIYDKYTNLDIIKKLDKLGVGVITEEYVQEEDINKQIDKLFKKPFWTFAKNSYGSATYLAKTNKVQGIIYISSFACGIDSIVIELIKDELKDFPILVLKIDEQTGEAGFYTRLEAFADMLERRCS
ncbi:acyl-CoA dehydratase activase-related protein [Clostridium niameyense]|uniref:acyl-CoA dehydratase activase-related protein n=1 Tax=Clostridium niameyense TaxID=1622073 RepID=UPI00067F7106|nr:acyl-CoA dehydratase activase-related protein [Clostridium niameyense]